MANEHIGRHRYVVAYQRRRLSDLLFYNILKIVARRNGDFWFLFLGRAREDYRYLDSKLCGAVYVFSDRLVWHDILNRRLRVLQEKINQIAKSRNY